MEVTKIILTMKILLITAVKVTEGLKCYRCTYKVGDVTFPVGLLPQSSLTDNHQCVDPFNKDNNKISVTGCDNGHCVKKIFKFDGTVYYQRDCMSSCESFSNQKVEGFDNVRLDQSCCDEDKCNSASKTHIHIYLTCIMLILALSFKFL